MKAFLCFLFAAATAFAADVATARACKQYVETCEGRMVTLDVMFLNPLDTAGSLPNALVALGYTWDARKNAFGGAIPVLFQRKEGERMLKRYGTTADFRNGVRTRALRGVLTRILRDGKPNLLYLDCSDSGPYADAIKPALAPVLDSLPDEVPEPVPPAQVNVQIVTPPPPPPPPPACAPSPSTLSSGTRGASGVSATLTTRTLSAE